MNITSLKQATELAEQLSQVGAAMRMVSAGGGYSLRQCRERGSCDSGAMDSAATRTATRDDLGKAARNRRRGLRLIPPSWIPPMLDQRRGVVLARMREIAVEAQD